MDRSGDKGKVKAEGRRGAARSLGYERMYRLLPLYVDGWPEASVWEGRRWCGGQGSVVKLCPSIVVHLWRCTGA